MTWRSALEWRVRFVALALIWGSSFLFIKVGIESFAPLQVALGRMALGALALLAVLLVTRDRLPRQPRVWAHLTFAAFLMNVLPFSLFAYAEQRISSSLAGICNAATPLFTLLTSIVVLSGEKTGARRVSGLLLGFAGVAVVVGVWNGLGGGDTAGTAMALAAALCYGLGGPYLRRYLTDSGHSTVSLSTTQLLLGTVQLLIITPLATSRPEQVSTASVLSVVVLGVLGTGFAYVLMYGLVRDVGPTVTSTLTYLFPVVAVAAGILFLDERLRWYEAVGAAIVLAGAWLTQNSGRRTQPSAGGTGGGGTGSGATGAAAPAGTPAVGPVPRR